MAGGNPRHSAIRDGDAMHSDRRRVTAKAAARDDAAGRTVRRRPLLALPFTLALAILLAPAAAGQSFGQWWWDAALGASQRRYDNFVDGTRVNRFDQTDLRLSLGVNGYILHPAVAGFRLGLDALFTSVENGHKLDSDRTGYEGRLSLFPQGAYPARLFVRRQLFDYSGLTRESPLGLLGTPDTSTSWGGRLRLRRGPLRGSLLGFERSELNYLGTTHAGRLQERQFYDWSGNGEDRQRHLRLERSFEEFGLVDFNLETLTLNVDQRQQLTPSWRWNLTGVALRRNVQVGGGEAVGIDSARLHSAWVHGSEGGGDLLTLIYDGGLAGGTEAGTVQSHTATARYLWRRRKGWELTPFARLGYQQGPAETLQSPQLGLAANWQRTGRRLDLSVTPTASYLQLNRSGSRSSGTDSRLALSVESSLGHGDEGSLRQEIEISVAHNELRLAGETLTGLPDLGVQQSGTGTQDFYRGRLTLRRRWGRLLAVTYGEWSRREGARDGSGSDFELELLTYNLQLTAQRFGLLATSGDTRLLEERTGEQSIRFYSLSAAYRPVRLLSLRGSYRTDDRQVRLGPDIEGDRSEAGFELFFGAFVLQGQYFESNERLLGGSERMNRGFTVNLSRRLAGWLPFVTGTQRRGVIR